MSLVKFDYTMLGDKREMEEVIDLWPVLEKEKLLLVEEDPSVEHRHLLLDTSGRTLAPNTALSLVVTHQILIPMNITVHLHLKVDQTHQINVLYIQEIIANEVTSLISVKGVAVEQGSIECNSQVLVRGNHQNISVRTEKKFIIQDQGQIYSRPELTDLRLGMRASHGLTISGLDQRQLYFMMSRGLPKSWSRELLLS